LVIKETKNKVERGKKGLLGGFFFDCRLDRFGFGYSNLFLDFFDLHAFRGTSRHGTEFRARSVRSACKGELTFTASPDADAYASNADKAALGASVGFFEFSYDFDVAFSDCGAVTRT
jgi:hypothetical protein